MILVISASPKMTRKTGKMSISLSFQAVSTFSKP